MVVDFPDGCCGWRPPDSGGLKTGGVPPKTPATIFLSLSPSVFWDFGSLFRTLRRHFLTRCCGSRIFVHVVAATSAWCRGTSQRNIASDVSAIPDVAASRITRRRATAISTFFLYAGERLRNQRLSHAGERLRDQRLSHAGVRLRYQRLSHAGERLRDQRLSVYQSSPACHVQTAGITFQLLPCKRWEGCRV